MSSERIELFPVTIFKAKVRDNKAIKNLLCSRIIENSENLTIPSDWITSKIKTSFDGEPQDSELFYNDSPYLNFVSERYFECMESIFDKQFQYIINKIWYNVYQDGEYQEEHDHLGNTFYQSQFSCIHFLSFDKKEHRPPEFRDPLSQLRNLSIEFESNRCGEIYVPSVEEGDLLVFPSYLVHRVLPCKKTDYPRITISFNIKVLKYGDDE